jgi:hypothetical protein
VRKPTLRRLRAVFRRVARRDTAYVPLEHRWSPDDPLVEHCGAAAYSTWRILGGRIMSGRDEGGVRWLWNELPDGRQVSLATEGPITAKGRPTPPRKAVNPRFALFHSRVLAHL